MKILIYGAGVIGLLYAVLFSKNKNTDALYIYLLPAFVLGIVPLLIFAFDKEKKSTFCWFCYGFALIGLIQICI